jgi:hypothetical protein
MKNQFERTAARPGQLISTLVLGAMLGLTQPARAQETPMPAGVVKIADFSYRVWASNPTAQRGKLQLVSTADGKVLYEERSSSVSFGRRFDIRYLPDGQYAFVVKLGKQQYRYGLNVQTTSQRSSVLSAGPLPTRSRLAAGLLQPD